MYQFQPDTGLCSGALPPLATGTSEFVQLRCNGESYVDKTAEIARLLAYPPHYLFLSRPRRLGKTLMLSTMGTTEGAGTGRLQPVGVGPCTATDGNRTRF